MQDVAVIDDPAAAGTSLDPVRARLLAELAEPASASTLAVRMGQPRQRINYHLKAQERRKGNCVERVLQASAARYVISPAVLAGIEPDPAQSPDRLSARWLLALAARLVRDVGELMAGANRAGKKLATFALDGEVRFASAADRTAFAEELVSAVTALAARYHDDSAPRGRRHRLVVAVHPSVSREGDR
jgi:hypothetical protein